MSNFSLAQQPEVIHGENKDKELLSEIKQKLMALLEHLLPARVLFRHSAWIGSVAALIYYGANSGRLRQTIGEEYAYLRQYNPTDHVFISRRRLLLFVLMEAFGESFIVPRLAAVFDRWLRRQMERDEQETVGGSFFSRLVTAIARQIGDAQSLFAVIMRLHTALFYVGGQYFTFTKRLAGIQHLQAVKIQPHAFSYRRIGLLIIFQMLVGLGIHLYKAISEALRNQVPKTTPRQPRGTEDHGRPSPGENETEASLKCGICFDRLAGPSAIPCGHVFCWECIVKSSQFKAECPSCRQPFETKEITFLGNINV